MQQSGIGGSGTLGGGRDRRSNVWIAIGSVGVIAALAGVMLIGASMAAQHRREDSVPAAASGEASTIAPIGVRVDRYAAVPGHARGPAVDPTRGYFVQRLGDGLYMIGDGAYQSMFMVHEQGVVVVDAPPSYAAKIRQAIAEVTDKPLTHLVYS